MRNQRMDLFQCAAIYSVVLLYIKTGLLDGQTAALTRFAAPFFLLGAWAHFGEERHTSLWVGRGARLGRSAGHCGPVHRDRGADPDWTRAAA